MHNIEFNFIYCFVVVETHPWFAFVMNCKRLTWYILWCIGSVHVVVQAIVVSRQTLDLFSNPNPENCVDDKRYCSGRKATCFGENCCTCKCRKGYSTFHSPGVSYYLENGTAAYRFDKKESCAWNHYAHEGNTINTSLTPFNYIRKDLVRTQQI